MPAWLPWSIVFVLVVIVAYLLGQRSRPAPATVAAAPSVAAVESAAPPAAEAPPPPSAPAWVEPTPEPAATWAPASERAPAETAPAAAPAEDPARLRVDVAGYFGQVESIERGAKYWQDPQALATALLTQIASGDSSGFDRLIDSSRQTRQRLQALEVPGPCREHHDRTLALMDRGLELLEGVRRSALAGDQSALLALQSSGKDLERQAREVDALALEVKQRHGLGS